MIRKYIFIKAVKDQFIYADIKCGGKTFRYDLGSNRITFHKESKDLLPQFISKYNWDIKVPPPINEIAIGLKRRINKNVSPLMLWMLMDTIEDGMTGTQAAKLCSYCGNSEYKALVKYFGEPEIRQSTGVDKKVGFDYIEIDAFISVLLSYSNQKKVAIHYQKQIIMDALKIIKDSKEFQNYNIPINFLKIDKMTINKTGIIHMLFSLINI